MVQDIIDGLSGFGTTIGGGIISGISNVIQFIVDIVMFPINSLIKSIFPDFTNAIQTFSEGITAFVSAPIGYFAYHIPPITKSVILLYLSIMLGYYSIIWIYRGIILIPVVINKLKFW